MLRIPGEYLHAISTLAAASALAAHHPGTRLLASGQAGRTPDLLLEIPEEHGLRVEVKAPETLYRTPHQLDVGTAIETVKRAVRKAGTGTRGQLATPGILAIAGWAMSEETFQILSHGISVVLRPMKDHKQHLFGLAIFNVRLTPGVEDGRVVIRYEQVSRLHRNPHYTGDLDLVGDWAAGWTLKKVR